MVTTRQALKLLALTALLGLSACATPQQRCIATASAEARGLLAEIRETEATISRGFALYSQSVPYRYSSVCYDREKKPLYLLANPYS